MSANGGDDKNAGTSAAKPWKTLGKVNATTLKPCDQVLFQRGNSFYGSLTVNQSGSSGSPITFGAYDTGEKPVLTGFTPVTAWTKLTGNIWESTNAVSTLAGSNMVTIAGVDTPMGRTPNSDAPNGGYLTYQSFTGMKSITSSSLTGTPDWTGAEAIIKTQRFCIDRAVIASQTTGTLTLSTPVQCSPTAGYGFFFQNHLRTLDQQNEWFFDSKTKKLDVYSSAQPAATNVATVDSLFSVNGNYITLNNLTLTGANQFAIGKVKTADHLTIDSCDIRFTGQDAVNATNADHLVILNTRISDSNNKAIDASNSTNVTIDGNSIKNSAVLVGMHQSDGAFSAVQLGQSVKTGPILFQNNSIVNTGHNGLTFGADGTIVKNNFIDTFCVLMDDGAGIYGGNNGVVTGNIVVNGIGNPSGTSGSFPTVAAGIYMDNLSSGVEVSNNSVAHTVFVGLFLNVNADNMTVTGNTVFDTRSLPGDTPPGVFRINFRDELRSYNLKVQGNIFVAKDSTQYAAYYSSVVNNIALAGTYDNNHYLRPIDDTKVLWVTEPDTGGNQQGESVGAWKTRSGQEVHSVGSPQTVTSVDDLRFEYNTTRAPRSVQLSQAMLDAAGVVYQSSVTLQPYTSVLLMKKN